jgi:hypothetical protein
LEAEGGGVTARLRRVQVEALRQRRDGSVAVGFNDGVEAKAAELGVVAQLSRAHKSAAMVDVRMTGKPGAWLVEQLLQSSHEWRQMEIL